VPLPSLSIQQVSFHTHTPWWWNWGNGLYHRRRRWHGLRLYMVILCPNTHRYTYYRVRGSHVLLLSVSVSVLVVCVFCVWGCCCPHTRYSGLCCSALPRLPPFIRMRPCLCAWTRSHIYLWCVCLAHTPTPPPTLSNTRTRMHMSSRACIPKVICICVWNTAQYMHLTTTTLS
jgi:hypothetical protein